MLVNVYVREYFCGLKQKVNFLDDIIYEFNIILVPQSKEIICLCLLNKHTTALIYGRKSKFLCNICFNKRIHVYAINIR